MKCEGVWVLAHIRRQENILSVGPHLTFNLVWGGISSTTLCVPGWLAHELLRISLTPLSISVQVFCNYRSTSSSNIFDKFSFLTKCVCIGVYVGLWPWEQVLSEAWRDCWSHWNQSHRWLWVTQHEFWKLNLGPLGEQYESLTIFPISLPNIFYGFCGSELLSSKTLLQLLNFKFQDELNWMISFCV